ncbi:MAG: four helix bundle protein [Gemmatimonadaceae bacterium]
MQDYHRLLVWQKAHDLTLNVHRASRSFQRSGCVGLRGQLVRAAESVPTNIVEGCFAATPKEFARFLDISIKSTGEVEYQLQLARDYNVLPQDRYTLLTAATIEVRRMLVGLRKKVLTPPSPVSLVLPTRD